MEFSVGQIVKAKAGRDKDSFFIIQSVNDGYAYIVDGRRRRVDKPKKKKLIHLAPTKTVVQDYKTNKKVISELSAFANKLL